MIYIVLQFIPETIKRYNAYSSIINDIEGLCSSIEMLLCISVNCLSISNDNTIKIIKKEMYCRQEECKANNDELAWATHLILPDYIDKIKKDIEKRITKVKSHPFYVYTDIVFIKTLETIEKRIGKYVKCLEIVFKFELKNSVNNEINPLTYSLRGDITRIYEIFKSKKIVIRKYYELTETEVQFYNAIMEVRKKDLPEGLDDIARTFLCIKRAK